MKYNSPSHLTLDKVTSSVHLQLWRFPGGQPKWNLIHCMLRWLEEVLEPNHNLYNFSKSRWHSSLIILCHGRQGATYSTWPIPWLLMTWWHKEPGHQQPWYWSTYLKIFQSQHQKGWCLSLGKKWRLWILKSERKLITAQAFQFS